MMNSDDGQKRLQAVIRDYGGLPTPPKFDTKEEERDSLKDRLSKSCRIFDLKGYNENLLGMLSFRDPVNPEIFWVSPRNTHWSLIQPPDLLCVDVEANILEGNGEVDEGRFLLHSAIYTARPDVKAIGYAQSPHGTAFSHRGIPLLPLTQDSCAFFKDNAFYDGLLEDKGAYKAMVNALGERKVLFIKNNGFLLATRAIEAVLSFFIACEKSCQVQNLADLAAKGRGIGAPHPIGDEEAYNTYKTVGTDIAGFFNAWPEYQALSAREEVQRGRTGFLCSDA